MMPRESWMAALAVLAIAGCGREQAGGAKPGVPSKAAALHGHTIPAPCEWLGQAEVESTLGKLLSPPRVGRSASNPRADPEGAACVYSTLGTNGKPVEVAVQVDPLGSAAAEQAATTLGDVFARELNDGAPAKAAAPEKKDGWDYAGGLPEMRVWRVGHVAIAIGGAAANFLLPEAKLAALASKVRERVPDQPMVQPGASLEADSSPDPCALLSRADAESVLGKLGADPYRSTEGTPLVDGEGASCSYYSPGHRVLVLTPTREQGKVMFGMVSGASGLIRQVTGGSDGSNGFEGPWDQSAEGSTGSLYFLAGDEMLEIEWRTSSTDARGAARLAKLVMPKLASAAARGS